MRSRIIQLFLLILTAYGMYQYNASTPLLKSLDEERFESWLIDTEKRLQDGKLQNSILVELSSTSQTLKGSWIMSYNPEKEGNASASKIVGLLRLLRASKAFSLNHDLIDDNGYAFSIRSGNEHFSSYFPSDMVANNISLKSLIILMREYTKAQKDTEAA